MSHELRILKFKKNLLFRSVYFPLFSFLFNARTHRKIVFIKVIIVLLKVNSRTLPRFIKIKYYKIN